MFRLEALPPHNEELEIDRGKSIFFQTEFTINCCRYITLVIFGDGWWIYIYLYIIFLECIFRFTQPLVLDFKIMGWDLKFCLKRNIFHI